MNEHNGWMLLRRRILHPLGRVHGYEFRTQQLRCLLHEPSVIHPIFPVGMSRKPRRRIDDDRAERRLVASLDLDMLIFFLRILITNGSFSAILTAHVKIWELSIAKLADQIRATSAVATLPLAICSALSLRRYWSRRLFIAMV